MKKNIRMMWREKMMISKSTCFDQLLDEFFLHPNGDRELSNLLLCLKKAQLRNTFKTFQTSTQRHLPCTTIGCKKDNTRSQEEVDRYWRQPTKFRSPYVFMSKHHTWIGVGFKLGVKKGWGRKHRPFYCLKKKKKWDDVTHVGTIKGELNIIFLYIDDFFHSKHKILQMLKRKISLELDWRLDQQTL